MDAVSGETRRRLVRALLIAAGAGILWAVFTLFAQASPSSAAEDDGTGLLGSVTSTVNSVTGTASRTVGAVERTAGPIVKSVEPISRPAAKVAPKPVRDAAAAITKRAVDTVHTSTAALDHTLTTSADATLTLVSQAAAPTVLAGVVGAPESLDPLVPALALGDVVDPLLETASATVAPATIAVPATAARLPQSPVPAGVTAVWKAASVAFAAVASVGVSGALIGAQGKGAPSGPLSPMTPTGTFILALGGLAALAVLRPRFSPASFPHHRPDDDALPGAPVFETDTSPD